MVSWVVQSLLFCAVFGAVFCDSPEVQIVKNLIAISNKAFREHNATEIRLPGIGPIPILEPTKFWDGRLGELDTLELLPNPQIKSRHNTYGTLYTFIIQTALRDLFIHYNFQVDIPFFANRGNVTITVNEKAFEAVGRVLAKNDGTCYAVLQNAKVVKLGDFQVKYEPDHAPWLTYLYQTFLNIFHKNLIPLINAAIRTEITRTSFRKNFNKYVCDEVTRNSTTEVPTTYSPTTEQSTQPSTTTRRPSTPTTPEVTTPTTPEVTTPTTPEVTTPTTPEVTTPSTPEEPTPTSTEEPTPTTPEEPTPST